MRLGQPALADELDAELGRSELGLAGPFLGDAMEQPIRLDREPVIVAAEMQLIEHRADLKPNSPLEDAKFDPRGTGGGGVRANTGWGANDVASAGFLSFRSTQVRE